MTRAVALIVTLAFIVGAVGTPLAWAQAKAPAAKTETKPAAKDEKKPEPKKALIDINSASVDELRTLDGIGEVYSKKDQLVSRTPSRSNASPSPGR